MRDEGRFLLPIVEQQVQGQSAWLQHEVCGSAVKQVQFQLHGRGGRDEKRSSSEFLHHCAVRMTAQQPQHSVSPLQQVGKRGSTLEGSMVHVRYPQGDGRMMHANNDRRLGGAVQFGFEPGEHLWNDAAVVLAGNDSIKANQSEPVQVLDPAEPITWRVYGVLPHQHALEKRFVVMVAGDESHGEVEHGEQVPGFAVSIFASVVGYIAGNKAQARRRFEVVEPVYAALQGGFGVDDVIGMTL